MNTLALFFPDESCMSVYQDYKKPVITIIVINLVKLIIISTYFICSIRCASDTYRTIDYHIVYKRWQENARQWIA